MPYENWDHRRRRNLSGPPVRCLFGPFGSGTRGQERYSSKDSIATSQLPGGERPVIVPSTQRFRPGRVPSVRTKPVSDPCRRRCATRLGIRTRQRLVTQAWVVVSSDDVAQNGRVGGTADGGLGRRPATPSRLEEATGAPCSASCAFPNRRRRCFVPRAARMRHAPADADTAVEPRPKIGLTENSKSPLAFPIPSPRIVSGVRPARPPNLRRQCAGDRWSEEMLCSAPRVAPLRGLQVAMCSAPQHAPLRSPRTACVAP
jgi:hypothetical protein